MLHIMARIDKINRHCDIVICPNPDPLGRSKLGHSVITLSFLVAMSVTRVVGMNAKQFYSSFPELPGNSQQLQETRFFGRRRDLGPILLALMGIGISNQDQQDLSAGYFSWDTKMVIFQS